MKKDKLTKTTATCPRGLNEKSDSYYMCIGGMVLSFRSPLGETCSFSDID